MMDLGLMFMLLGIWFAIIWVGSVLCDIKKMLNKIITSTKTEEE